MNLPDAIRELAEKCAAFLFTSGNVNRDVADRLVLTTKDGRELGGWGQQPMARQLERLLEDQLRSLLAAHADDSAPRDGASPPVSIDLKEKAR